MTVSPGMGIDSADRICGRSWSTYTVNHCVTMIGKEDQMLEGDSVPSVSLLEGIGDLELCIEDLEQFMIP